MFQKHLVAGFLGFITAGSAFATSGRHYVVSLVPKGTVSQYLLRMAADKNDVVVTRAPIAGALEQRTIDTQTGEQLLVIEEQRDAKAATALLGENFRMGSFVIATRVSYGQQHWFDPQSPQNYVAAVPDIETTEPAVSQKTSLLKDSFGAKPLSGDIDPEFLKEQVSFLSGAKPVVIDGQTYTIKERGSAANKALARKYLKNAYEQLGFTVHEEKYSSTGINFVAEKAGATAGKFLLLTSHLDSVNNAGADDDLAGTITNLAAVKALAGQTLQIGLRVVAFDQEEQGLVGSKAYAKGASTAGTLGQIVGVLNNEMTGYDKDKDYGFHVIDCNENTSATLTKAVMDAVTREGLPLKKVAACTNRSDHASFWTYKVPAVVISQNFFGGDSNPCYHQACDKVDIMNFSYMQAITKAVASATQALVVVQ